MVRAPKQKRTEGFRTEQQTQTQSTNREIGSCSYSPPLDLPIGYRFAPKEEELVLILHQWQRNPYLNHPVVHHVNIYESNPQQLSERFEKGNDENEWFFISKRTKKCNGGKNLKRGNNEGYWDARTAAKRINAGKGVIGYKNLLNYCVGKKLKGAETDWRMHEYWFKSSCDDNDKVDYALCKIFLTPREEKKKSKKDTEAEKKEEELAPQLFVEEVQQFEYQQRSLMLMMPEAEEEEQHSLMMMPEAEEEQQQSLVMMPELEDEQQLQQVTWSLPPPFSQDPLGQDSGMEMALTSQSNNDNNIVLDDDDFSWVMDIPDEVFDSIDKLSQKFVP